jgi:hypothetical protein
MKKILILPLLMFVLNVAAQIDTAYIPPFAYLTFDTQEWEISDSESERYSSVRLKGKIDKGFELKIRLNLGDTLITKENLLAKFDIRTPYGREMVVESSSEMGDYILVVFSFSQDECSRNEIPAMFKSMKFRAAFRIIDNTNLLSVEIDDDSFFFPEETQTKKLQDIVNAIHVVTPSQIDQLLDLPMTPEKATALIKRAYDKSYKESFDFNLSKRKCFDDSYFYDELQDQFEYPTVDSLLHYASDSTICDLVASHQAALDSSEYANEIKYKVEIGFNYTERTEIFYKARNEAFSLEEYLDFQLGEIQEGPIQRLKAYSGNNFDSGGKEKYEGIIQELFAKKYIPGNTINDIYFDDLGNHKYLMKVHSTRQDSLYETIYFHIEKNSSAYEVNRILLPSGESSNWERRKSSSDNSPYIDERELVIYFPLWDIQSRVNPSPKKQLITLYDAKNLNSSFPSYISIGNSKDIKWIPVSPVILDSTKYVLIHKIGHYENEYVNTDQFTVLWREFGVQSEKQRLNSIFNPSFGITLDKVAELRTRTVFAESDISISPYEVNGFIERNTLVNYIAYVEEGIEDINKDGIEDLYSIVISNGKVIGAKAYIIKGNTYEILDTKAVLRLLIDNTGFNNLLLQSQIGNRGTKEIQKESDLLKVVQE